MVLKGWEVVKFQMLLWCGIGKGRGREESSVGGGEGTSDLEKKTDKNQSRGWRILLRRDSHIRFLSTEIYAIFKSPKLNGFRKL